VQIDDDENDENEDDEDEKDDRDDEAVNDDDHDWKILS